MKKEDLQNIKVEIENKTLLLTYNNSVRKYPLKKLSKKLSTASDNELKDYVVSPSGYGIHWNSIDEDISIPALLNEPFEKYKES